MYLSLQEGWDSEKEESLSAVITFSIESGSDCSGFEFYIFWFADLAPASLGFEAPFSCLLMSLPQAFLLTQQTHLQLLADFGGTLLFLSGLHFSLLVFSKIDSY